jgi:hypothetical protein
MPVSCPWLGEEIGPCAGVWIPTDRSWPLNSWDARPESFRQTSKVFQTHAYFSVSSQEFMKASLVLILPP